MKLSDYVAGFLADLGIKHAFIVSGGASIHLLHSLHATAGIEPICTHHEQAAAMAADAYARATGGLGCSIATSGPGATNMVTGIAGAWFDSIPTIFISGQVTTFRQKGNTGVRQYGFQETEILPMVEPITKYAVQLSDASMIRYELEKAVSIARAGRPGPVLIDIPDDLQRAEINPASLVPYDYSISQVAAAPSQAQLQATLDMLRASSRPVLVFGHGIRLAGATEDARALAEQWGVPVLTTWGAKDILEAIHPLNAGTFGTHGTRAGNFAVQNSDFVLSIGARLSTRETGTPISDWARGAKVAVVDVDPAELRKFAHFGRPIDSAIEADAGVAIQAFRAANCVIPDVTKWRAQIDKWRELFPVGIEGGLSLGGVEPYAFMRALTEAAPADTHIFTDTGCSVAWLMQAGRVRGTQRLHHDCNNTAMGWGLPAAIAGALALNRTVVCLSGDGSLMMNVQELSTLVCHNLPVKVILVDNGGYSMVRQTEEQWMHGLNVGTSTESGLAFPEWLSLAQSFGIEARDVGEDDLVDDGLTWLFADDTPKFLRLKIDADMRVTPQVSFGYGIEDAEPHLPRRLFLEQMFVDPLPRSLEPTNPKRTLSTKEWPTKERS